MKKNLSFRFFEAGRRGCYERCDCGCIDCLREFGKFLFGCRFERCCLYAGHLYRQGYRYG